VEKKGIEDNVMYLNTRIEKKKKEKE